MKKIKEIFSFAIVAILITALPSCTQWQDPIYAPGGPGGVGGVPQRNIVLNYDQKTTVKAIIPGKINSGSLKGTALIYFSVDPTGIRNPMYDIMGNLLKVGVDVSVPYTFIYGENNNALDGINEIIDVYQYAMVEIDVSIVDGQVYYAVQSVYQPPQRTIW